MKRRDTFTMIPLTVAGLAGLSDRAGAQMHMGMVGMDGMGKQCTCGKCPYCIGAKSPTYPRQYIDTCIAFLEQVRAHHADDILEAGYWVARAKMQGRNVWSYWDQGHTHRSDVFPGRNGDPDLITAGYDPKKTRDGDVMLASFPFPARGREDWVKDLNKKDMIVIGAPSPVSGDCKHFEQNIEEIRNLKFRPFSDVWIETGITSVGAAVKIPGSPAPLGPVTGPVYMTLWWMINAGACRVLAINGKNYDVKGDGPVLGAGDADGTDLDQPLMDVYMDTVIRQMKQIFMEEGDMREMARMAVDTLLAGNSVYFYSQYPEALRAEALGRRGGFGFAKGAYDEHLAGERGDMVVMGITEPDNARDLTNLDDFRNRGMKIASIGPVTRDRKLIEGRAVYKESDVHLGRMADTYGLFKLPGFSRPVCPTSGPLNVASLWAMSNELAAQMKARTGDLPGIYFSGSLLWGNRYNTQMRTKVAERGY